MEHNFTFASIEEMNATHEIIDFFLGNQGVLRQLVGVTTLQNFPYLEYYPANVPDMLDRLTAVLNEAYEAETAANKPAYEHRYVVRDGDEEILAEFDSLKEAYDNYEEHYHEKYANDYYVSEGDFDIYDNKVEDRVTAEVPYFEPEFEWSVDLDVTYDGRKVYEYERPDWVMEVIADEFRYGDESGTATDEVGNISWDDICDWESDHDKTEVGDCDENGNGDVCWDTVVNEELNAEANTTTKSESTDENTWHVY